MSKFTDELDELVDQFVEEGEATIDTIIIELEKKVAALKEEHSK